jgi:hypothetical protein
VRRMLVDEYDPVVVLEQHERPAQLEQRRNDRGRRIRRGSSAEVCSVANGPCGRRPVRGDILAWREKPVCDGCHRAQQLHVGRPFIFQRGPARRPASNAEGSARVEGTQGAPHCFLHCALDGPAVLKAHLGLGGVHIDVDTVAWHHELQQERRTQARGERRAIRAFGGAQQAVVAYRTTIHRDERSPARGADVGRPLDQAAHLGHTANVLHVDQAVARVRAPERGDAIA